MKLPNSLAVMKPELSSSSARHRLRNLDSGSCAGRIPKPLASLRTMSWNSTYVTLPDLSWSMPMKSLYHEAVAFPPAVPTRRSCIFWLNDTASSLTSSLLAGCTPAIALRSSCSFLVISSAPERLRAVLFSFHPGPLAAASPFFMKFPNSFTVIKPEPSSSSARHRLRNRGSGSCAGWSPKPLASLRTMPWNSTYVTLPDLSWSMLLKSLYHEALPKSTVICWLKDTASSRNSSSLAGCTPAIALRS